MGEWDVFMVGFNQIASFFGDPKTISFKSDKSDSPHGAFFEAHQEQQLSSLDAKIWEIPPGKHRWRMAIATPMALIKIMAP